MANLQTQSAAGVVNAATIANAPASSPRSFPSFKSPLKLLRTVFRNVPDVDASLIHECFADELVAGLRAIIVRSSFDVLDPCLFGTASSKLALAQASTAATWPANNVFLQAADRGECFVPFSAAQKSIRLSLPAYICVLEFFASEDWVRIESKIRHQISQMREKLMSIPIETNLGFVSHGCCQYEANFENNLCIKARADSKDSSNRIYAWIEYQSDTLELEPMAAAVLAKNLPFLTKLFKEGPPAKKSRQL